MKNLKHSLIMLLLLSLSSFSINTVDSKEDGRPQNAQSRDHGNWLEKRFVARIGADGVQRVEMVGGEYFFDPNYIVVKVKKPVEIKVKKTPGYILHDLTVKAPEAGIDIAIKLQEEAQTVKFTPTKIGKYPIYCGQSMLWLKPHRERGMEGLIEVVK